MSIDDLFDEFLNSKNNEDPLKQEEKRLVKAMRELTGKLKGTDSEPVTNEDLLQYMQIINFNFASLQRLIHAMHTRQSLFEETLFNLNVSHDDLIAKINGFFETQTLLDDSLPKDSKNSKEM